MEFSIENFIHGLTGTRSTADKFSADDWFILNGDAQIMDKDRLLVSEKIQLSLKSIAGDANNVMKKQKKLQKSE
jgi:hypothetical protein